jgi:hypothetical protein
MPFWVKLLFLPAYFVRLFKFSSEESHETTSFLKFCQDQDREEVTSWENNGAEGP